MKANRIEQSFFHRDFFLPGEAKESCTRILPLSVKSCFWKLLSALPRLDTTRRGSSCVPFYSLPLLAIFLSTQTLPLPLAGKDLTVDLVKNLQIEKKYNGV